MKKLLVGVSILAILGIGVGLLFTLPSNATHNPKIVLDSSSTPAAAKTVLTSTSLTPTFTIQVNDTGANHETITVKKDAEITLTIYVLANTTNSGKLTFASVDPAFDSGPISAGSTKTLHFNVHKSFVLQPHDFTTKNKKDYAISINVQD